MFGAGGFFPPRYCFCRLSTVKKCFVIQALIFFLISKICPYLGGQNIGIFRVLHYFFYQKLLQKMEKKQNDLIFHFVCARSILILNFTYLEIFM
jgi:hypothetical protein